ncbi:UDP-N-acetyl glucosamine 2-epimerase [Pasteurellaceae bacterium Macca]|nr:UDP-N-acetyl glucosamine 2-epimerase [Pasteurellaceae bacterium Macca]
MKILAVFGTRPEGIKMAPLIKALQQDPRIEIRVCVTGQHRQMLDQVLAVFDIRPDFDLDIMQQDQDLFDTTSRILMGLRPVLQSYQPNLCLVHGDTTTSFTASLACYYQKIPVAHIEAGLRTGNRFSPFPEEGNRLLTSVLADYHFAPTAIAQANLLQEGKPSDRIWVTGNSVIDALFEGLEKIKQTPPLEKTLRAEFSYLSEKKKLILVTGHRRESFGEGFERICQALREIACQQPNVEIVYPVHLNPKVAEPVKRWLSGIENIFLIEPLNYLPFIYLMNRSDLLLTDSGGIQEEAPALGKPVLVMREMTERPEALTSGLVQLVGTDSEKIIRGVCHWLNQPPTSPHHSPYGDGKACERIVDVIKRIAK